MKLELLGDWYIRLSGEKYTYRNVMGLIRSKEF